MRSTQAWLSNNRAQTNCFVDDPIIPLKRLTTSETQVSHGCVGVEQSAVV